MHSRKAVLAGGSSDLGRLVRRGLEDAGTGVRELQPGSYSADYLEQICSGVDVVVHLERPVPRYDGRSPSTATAPFTQLLEAAVGSVRRFVLHSSVQVYAPVPTPSRWPILEHFPLLAHGTAAAQAYGQRKIDEEKALSLAAARGSMEFVVLRPTEVFGVGGGFAEQLLDLIDLQPAVAVGRYSATGVMQWVHVEDVADAMVAAAVNYAAADQAFNIAGPESFTVAELAEMAWSRDPFVLRADRPAKFTSVKAAAIMGWAPGRRLSDALVPLESPRWSDWRSTRYWPLHR